MEKKYIVGSIIFTVILILYGIYKFKNSDENRLTTKIDSPENLNDLKLVLNNLTKILDSERKNKKIISKQLKEISNLNKIQIKYLKNFNKPEIFGKNIEKHRLFIDTHNINNENLDRSNYTYHLNGSSDTGAKNQTAGYGELKNVIGFRLVKAVIPNTNHVVLNTRNVLIVELDNEFNNFIGTKVDTNNSDPGNGRIKFNQSTIESATQAFISETNSSSKDISDFLLDGNNFLRIENSDSTQFIDFNITDVVENTNYRTLTIDTTGLSSTLTDFDENDVLKVYLLNLNNIEDRGKKIKIILQSGFFNTDTIQESFSNAIFEWYGGNGGTSQEQLINYRITCDFGNISRLFTFTMNNNRRFRFVWSEVGLNSAITLLGFTGDIQNFSTSINAHNPPDMSINYIDLIIDEIPYIACKKNAKGLRLIDRIGITSGISELFEYVQEWNSNNENYFFPIRLDRLSIKLFETTQDHYFINDRDHTLEFEITIIKNNNDFNLV